MDVKSGEGGFNPLFLIKCLFLSVLISVPLPRPGMASDYPTINELMEKGELDEELSEDAPFPQADETPPPSYEEVETPEPPPPATAAPQTAVPPPPIRLSQKVVMIGRVPFMSAKGILAQVKGLTGFLRKEVGVKDVRIVMAGTYAGVLNALERGTIDFAWLGPMAYVIGDEKTPLIPLAKANRRTGSTYRGVFITRRDSGILGIEDIKGKVIGFVDPESASGYLYPLFLLKRSRINPHKDCRKVEFLNKHDAVLAAVLSGKIDVGVCLEDTIEVLKDRKILDQILVLGKTDEVPSDVVACREDCHPSLREKFKDALIKTRSVNRKSGGSSGLPPIMEFLPVTDADFDAARNVLNAIKDLRKP